MTHLHLVLSHQRVKVLARPIDILPTLRVQFKLELRRRREVRLSRFRSGRPKIDLVRSKRRQYKLVQSQRRHPVHTRVFPKEPRPSIVEHEHCSP